jgi:hypothetical protein
MNKTLERYFIYRLWTYIKRRCHNKNAHNYRWYGGRGIRVCPSWLGDFDKFYRWCKANGYQHGLQLDRINTDGNYSPQNCRFVTALENNHNRRCVIAKRERVNNLCNL